MKITYNELLKRKDNLDKKSILETNRTTLRFAKELKRLAMQSKDVLILSDYDADGIMSANILSRTLDTFCETNPRVFIGDRVLDGYGVCDIDKLDLKEGTFVICSDLGSTDYKKIEEIFNITHVPPMIIDHHEIEESLVNYKYLLNFTGKKNAPDYCATGLAERMYQGLLRDLKVNDPIRYEALVECGLETEVNSIKVMACIGTIGDMVSVNNPYDNNRNIILNGFDVINEKKPLEYALHRFLYDVCKDCRTSNMTTEKMQFNVVPLINAMGRIETYGAKKVFDTLYADSYEDANLGLSELRVANNERKRMVEQIKQSAEYKEAIERVQKENDNIAVFVSETLPRGIVGLVAQSIAKELGVPSVVFTSKDSPDGSFVGSGRNVEGFPSLYDTLIQCKSFATIGGHTDALGCGVEKENLSKLLEEMRAMYKNIQPQKVEKEVLSESITKEQLLALEPFGVDFPKISIEKEIEIANVQKLKGGYISIFDKDGTKYFGQNIDCMAGDKVLVNGTLSYNEYRGKSSLQVNIADVSDVEKEKDERESEDMEK